MNADLPRHFYAYVREEFLHDLQDGHGAAVRCVAFGVASVAGRALGFHVLLDNGAQWARVPLHALVSVPTAPRMSLGDLCLWDSFGYDVEAVEFAYLRGLDVDALIGRDWLPGSYVCSLDWKGNGFSESAEQHKVMHLIALENGCYALQPNNRTRWHEVSFTTKPYDLASPPKYRVNTHVWHAETRRHAEDSDAFFYGMTDGD